MEESTGHGRAKKKSQGVEERNDREKKWMLSMEVMLGSIDTRDVDACSIPIIPQKLRKPNEDAYRPKIVSVGPVHRGRTDLLYMEEPKWRCMLHLLRRTKNEMESFKKLSRPVLRLDEIARASYASEIKFDSYDLAKIMLLDGCFILELLISSSKEMRRKLPCINGNDPDGPGIKLGEKETILSDLLVLENQVPFFVLKNLFQRLFPGVFTSKECESELIKMMLSLFGYPSKDETGNSEVSHLLQLVHSSITRDRRKADNRSQVLENSVCDIVYNNDEDKDQVYCQHQEQTACVELKRCATELQAAGIKIITPQCKPGKRLSLIKFVITFVTRRMNIGKNKPEENNPENGLPDSEPPNNPSNSKIVQRFDFGIKFDEGTGVLEIPPLHITKTTEDKWRNFIAWEQSRSDWRNTLDWEPNENGHNCKFTSYALFFRGLICCVHDIELLKEKKIIIDERKRSNEDLLKEKGVNNPGRSNEELLDMFHKITEGVDHMDSSYTAYCNELNRCSKTNPMNKWSLIKWHHFRRAVTNIIFLWRNLYKILKRDHMPTVWKTLGVVAAVVLLFLTIGQTVLAALSL